MLRVLGFGALFAFLELLRKVSLQLLYVLEVHAGSLDFLRKVSLQLLHVVNLRVRFSYNCYSD